MKFLAIIPARYASTRFPAKPLALLGGKPIIQCVYERVQQVFADICVATDDERIASVVRQFGGVAIMTSVNHRSGTDRCYEAFLKMKSNADVVVNVQGDEPFISESQLRTVMDCFQDEQTQIATLVKPFASGCSFELIENPNSPKVVLDKDGYALYFSRSVVPYLRGIPKDEWSSKQTFFKHIGLYAYRTDVLKKITTLPVGSLEQCESLEQLRWLENGLKIKVGYTDIETIGIDTPEDLKHAEEFLSLQQYQY